MFRIERILNSACTMYKSSVKNQKYNRFGQTCRFEVWRSFNEQVGVEAVDMGTN